MNNQRCTLEDLEAQARNVLDPFRKREFEQMLRDVAPLGASEEELRAALLYVIEHTDVLPLELFMPIADQCKDFPDDDEEAVVKLLWHTMGSSEWKNVYRDRPDWEHILV